MAKIHQSVNKRTLCKEKKKPEANVYQLLISVAKTKNVQRILCVSTVWVCAFGALLKNRGKDSRGSVEYKRQNVAH